MAFSPPWPARDPAHLLVQGERMAGLEEELFSQGMPVEALMERAGLALSRHLLESDGERLRRSGAVVLVGPGHNGGDGLVVARELHLAGIAVRIWCPFERCKPLTASHRRYATWLGVPFLEAPPDPGGEALWIDALFGVNQHRPPGVTLEALLEARREQGNGGLVSIDVPTGLCSDSGRLLGAAAARASRTLCLGLIKLGLVQDRALPWVGRLDLLAIGLPTPLLEGFPHNQPLGLHPGDLATAPWPRLPVEAGKYDRGRLLLLAGSLRYPGAAQLALLGSSASGCGCVRVAAPATLGPQLLARCPHGLLDAPLTSCEAGATELAGLAPESLERLDAVLLGPGLGRLGPAASPRRQAGLGGEAKAAEAGAWEALQAFQGLLVLDADGLNRLALDVAPARGEDAAGWLRRRRGPTWLTPHAGEFARLFPQWADAEPIEAAARAATGAEVSLVLKGAHSVVAGPDGRRWQLLEAEPSAARTGLGDVLAGYAAGLGAKAVASGEGARAEVLAMACLAHAEAGRQMRRTGGPGSATPLAIASALELAGGPSFV